jgi:hypothetical protein
MNHDRLQRARRIAPLGSLAGLAALALLWGAPAQAFRCGNALIVEGDPRSKVVNRCGEPTEVERKSILRRPVIWRYGRPYHVGSDEIEVPVEFWTYNLGPNKLMRRIRCEDGIVVSIETLGYGWWENAPPRSGAAAAR